MTKSVSEVDTYMRDNSPALGTNPLDWWKANQTCFPRLATLARRYLCVPETTVASERVFSAMGLAVNRLSQAVGTDVGMTVCFDMMQNVVLPKSPIGQASTCMSSVVWISCDRITLFSPCLNLVPTRFRHRGTDIIV